MTARVFSNLLNPSLILSFCFVSSISLGGDKALTPLVRLVKIALVSLVISPVN